MSLEALERDITRNAQKKVQEILNQGKEEAQAILKEARRAAKEKRKEEEGVLERQIDQLKSVQETHIRMKKNQNLLKEKKLLIDAVYDRFLLKLQKERTSVMKTLARQVRSEFSPGRVYVRFDDVKQARSLFKGIPIEVRPLKGGFIAESKSGDQLVDYSFETILDLVRSQTIKKVSTTLFGGMI